MVENAYFSWAKWKSGSIRREAPQRIYGKGPIMKRFVALSLAAGVLLMPLVYDLLAARSSWSAPPVAQPLVREGDFAASLMDSLGLGPANSEEEAENVLTSVGVMPKNGWVADYPVTPDIVAELLDSVVAAAGYRRLAMTRDEALGAFEALTSDYGLPFPAEMRTASGAPDNGSAATRDTRTASADLPAAEEPGQYPDSTTIDDYYFEEGPPVVTYYPPPWEYYYMYSWVAYPFWCDGLAFSGFFVLSDFDKFDHVVIVKNHGRHGHTRGDKGAVKLVSNHVVDRNARRVAVIDPVLRRTGNVTMISDDRAGHHGSDFQDRGVGGVAPNVRSNLERGRVSSDGPANKGSPGLVGRTGDRTAGGTVGQRTGKSSADEPRHDIKPGSGNVLGSPNRQEQMSVERSLGASSRSLSAPHGGAGGSFRSWGGPGGNIGRGGFSRGGGFSGGGGSSMGGGGSRGGGGGVGRGR
jgi:hypothetical protein